MSLDISLKITVDGNDVCLYDANITHNLTEMADKAGIYEALWHPEKNGCIDETRQQIKSLFLEIVEDKTDEQKTWARDSYWVGRKHLREHLKAKIKEL